MIHVNNGLAVPIYKEERALKGCWMTICLVSGAVGLVHSIDFWAECLKKDAFALPLLLSGAARHGGFRGEGSYPSWKVGAFSFSRPNSWNHYLIICWCDNHDWWPCIPVIFFPISFFFTFSLFSHPRSFLLCVERGDLSGARDIIESMAK